MRVPFLLTFFKASSQRPTSTERTFYRFNYLTLWCEVAPYTHKELYNSLSISAAAKYLWWRLQQREAQQKQRRNENRKTDNAWQWKLVPLHESVLSCPNKIIILGFYILFNRGNGNLLTSNGISHIAASNQQNWAQTMIVNNNEIITGRDDELFFSFLFQSIRSPPQLQLKGLSCITIKVKNQAFIKSL